MSDLTNECTIWKFVGGVSAVNGLVCFGLSSAYKISFGKFGIGGLLLYVLISSIMLSLIWLFKRFGVPQRYRGVVGPLIFVVMCVISVLLDKLVPGKSDALSIISYGSFALMSLFSSRKSEFGFESGFFTFFLSLFVEQLCKTNLKLSPVAVLFCLVVFALRHFSESGAELGCGSSNGEEVFPLNRTVLEMDNPPEDMNEERHGSPGTGEVSGQSPSSSTNNHTHRYSPRNYGQVSVSEEIMLNISDWDEQEEDPSSLSFTDVDEPWDQDQVSSENSTLTTSYAEPELISAAAPRLRRRGRRTPVIQNISSSVADSLKRMPPTLFFFLDPLKAFIQQKLIAHSVIL